MRQIAVSAKIDYDIETNTCPIMIRVARRRLFLESVYGVVRVGTYDENGCYQRSGTFEEAYIWLMEALQK